MDTMAWFRTYLEEHKPDGKWSAEAECTVCACIGLYRATGDAQLKQYVTAWAESLIAADCCVPASGSALFFALAETGEERFCTAIQSVMGALGRDVTETIDSAEKLQALLPFRMAYEMKLGGMEKVGLVTAKFREAYQALWQAESACFGGDLRGTARALLSLTAAIETCADQLYEHWRALVDIYREMLKGVLSAGVEGETAAMVVWALLSGVRMNLIDPERYLPVAKRYIAALVAGEQEEAAAVLDFMWKAVRI